MRRYFKKYISSQGLHIMLEVDGKEYHIAIMRWTDGLSKHVKKAVEDDADLIVASLNYYTQKDNLLEACKALAEHVSQQWEDEWENRPNHLRMAEEAIAKAKGVKTLYDSEKI